MYKYIYNIYIYYLYTIIYIIYYIIYIYIIYIYIYSLCSLFWQICFYMEIHIAFSNCAICYIQFATEVKVNGARVCPLDSLFHARSKFAMLLVLRRSHSNHRYVFLLQNIKSAIGTYTMCPVNTYP